MRTKRISERQLILLTVGLLIVAGLVRLASYRVGSVLFYLALVPFLLHRIRHHVLGRKKPSKADAYRRITLCLMLFSLLLNLLGFQRGDFLLLLLLGADYLILSYHGGGPTDGLDDGD
ncbi:MAG: hypothetical protein IJU72_00820 [Bacteroidales bacterium]|nr:hypothetical protein [Bacteroidales bacterium]